MMTGAAVGPTFDVIGQAAVGRCCSPKRGSDWRCVVRSAGSRNGLSSRGRSRKSPCAEGALVEGRSGIVAHRIDPVVIRLRRTARNAGAELVMGEQVEIVALEERQDRDGLAFAPVWPLPPAMLPMMPAPIARARLRNQPAVGSEDIGAIIRRARVLGPPMLAAVPVPHGATPGRTAGALVDRDQAVEIDAWRC